MKLGNLLYSGELINHEKVDYITYHNIEEDGLNSLMLVNFNELPTMVVGFSLLKKLYGDKYPDQSILDKIVIPNKLYWEFSFNENKKQNIDGIENFINEKVIDYYFFDFKYFNIDPIFNKISNEDDLIKNFPIIDCAYSDNRMLYVISSNSVFGLDLDVFDFYGFNINYIKNSILEKAIKRVIDPDNNIYLSYYRQFPELNFLKRYIPLFELVK